MRIAIVSQEYPLHNAKGGIGTQAYAKAHGLSARGHDVCVISRSNSSKREEEPDGKIQLIRTPAPPLQAHTEIADWLAYSTQVAAEVAEVHAASPLDLVEFPEWGCEGYVHLLNRTEWNRIPTAIHLHGPVVMLAGTLGWPEPGSVFHRVAMQMEATCLRLADAVYSSSACSAGWVGREYGLDSKSIPVLHTGVDTRHFSPRDIKRDDRPTIIFVGKLTWNKGVLVLLQAALRLASSFPGLRVRMLGRGEEHVITELRRQAAAAGCEDILEIPGAVDRDRLPEELSRAQLFAAPSRYEGGPGFVYLEAMACGLPVIACSGSGAAEVVIDGENGLLVPSDDVPTLANAMRKLLASTRDREAMARRARQYAIDYADSAKCLDKLEAFYKSVVDRTQRMPT